MRIDLLQLDCEWQKKKVSRQALEKQFEAFTGHLDVIELHVPYTKWNYVEDMMNKTRKLKGKKILVSAGDSLNLDMFSYFHHTSKDNTLPSLEIETLIRFLKIAQKVYDKIIFLESNHETRLTKVIFKNIHDKHVAQQVVDNIKTLKEIMEFNKLNKIVYVDNYFFQLGDAVVCHIENNSSTPGKICRDIVQYLTPRIHKPFNVVYQAHTHCQAKMSIDRKTVIETGACIDSLDYWRSGKMNGKGKMSTIGYAVGDMSKGLSDINKCNYIVKGWEGYL